MNFDLPNAVAAMNDAVAAVGEDGDSWEIIGAPLDDLVDGVVPDYDEKLDLKLTPSSGDKRAEICTVRWGKIEKDIARLTGLVAAARNISAVVRTGKDTIAHEWQGEAFDAFRVNIEKVERTLDDYATAVETTASGMTTALTGIRQLFTTYRDDTREKHLAFDRFSKPADWKRLSPADAEVFVENCGSQTAVSDCLYNNDQQVAIIDRKLTNTRLYDQLVQWDCTRDPGVVIGQYNYVVDSAHDERTSIRDKIQTWYDATDELERTVGEAFDAALENLRIIAELKIFSTFSVPEATAPTSGPGPTSDGDPGPTADGDPEPEESGSDPVDGDDAATPSPEPEPAAVEAASDEPAAPEAVVTTSATGDTVEIRDGDRTISVSSPDGQGLVRVTVDDGSGSPKTYALDFDAASGLSSGQDAATDDDVTHVPAHTNGKCVIQDGALTITAERALFSPDSIVVTVDDGTGPPTNYTLDFPEDTTPEEGPADTATSGPSQQPVPPGQVTSPQSALGDQRGSLSGILLSDHHDGEAGLASAPDAADSLGMVGAGLPVQSAPHRGDDPGRIGSGWSVHGDLFDSGEPVYSMHGVLGVDDLKSR